MRSAHRQFHECVALARGHGFGRIEVANLYMVGWTGLHLAEIGTAVAVGHEAIALAERASQPRAELMARTLVAWSDGVVRDRRAEGEEQAELALRLVRALGAKRFEGQLHGLNAVIALRRGDRQRAVRLADTGLAVCREHGMGHIGPWLHGVRALAETDPSARRQLLAEGERLLALGCVSDNHLQLPELAIEVFLELGDWDAVQRSCYRIRQYTAAEPLPFSEFMIARGLALLIPRQAGQREDRYMHALGDPADIEAILAARQTPVERSSGSRVSAERIEELEARIAALEERLAKLEG